MNNSINDKERRLILDLLRRYKETFLSVPLSEDGADELYKWHLINECQGKNTLAIIESFIEENIVDVQHVKPVLSDLISNSHDKLATVFEILTDEKKVLNERLATFKKAMAALCSDKFKVKANDERTAAAFLACWRPEKYTFYKNEIYQNYCNYIGEQPKQAGEKYQHYLYLLQPLSQAIKDDVELKFKFENETKGLLQSDLLNAQNILWQMKDMMNNNDVQPAFWSGGINWSDGETNNSKLEDFNNDGYWQIGWDKDSAVDNKGAKQAWNNIKEVKIGDFLAFHGYGGRNDLVIYQISRVTGKDEENGKLFFERLNNDEDELYSGKAPHMSKGGWFGTLFPVLGDEAINKIFGKFIGSNSNRVVMNPLIQQYTEILQHKKNIILQGAPGTGKTYNTAALALSICGVTGVDLNNHDAVMKRYEQMRYDSDKNPDGQIAFCTFHQSLDYEDFVEGIKPDNLGGSISYKIEKGLFRKISGVAQDNLEDSEKTLEVLKKQKSMEDRLFVFLENAVSQFQKFETKTKSQFTISKYDEDNITFYNEKNPVMKEIPASVKTVLEVMNSDLKLDQVSELKSYFNRKNGQQVDSYIFTICKIIRGEKLKDSVVVEKVALKNYALIIDEINRGNVSRIFGELITLLEADKRIGGEHPIKVTLPYSKDSFGVPSNLYIIGTMNTTDRSVGTIDYAVRRRFAFVTLESKREIVTEKCGEDSKAVQLFDAVKDFLQSHKADMDFEDLMVGHSYFMAENNDNLQLKLEYEIVPLIREYYKDGIISVSKKDLDEAISGWNEILKS